MALDIITLTISPHYSKSVSYWPTDATPSSAAKELHVSLDRTSFCQVLEQLGFSHHLYCLSNSEQET